MCMKDIVFEWYVPYIPDRKKQLLKAVIISAALVSFVDALFFAAAMLFVALALAVTGFFLFRSWRYEYEYVYDIVIRRCVFIVCPAEKYLHIFLFYLIIYMY